MAYTALEKMRQVNKKKYNKDVGPAQPPLWGSGLERMDLKSAALRFIHERCEELNFDTKKEEYEDETGQFLGTSRKPNQIPYNMQMDLNRLCLEKSLERFIDSGVAEDAYEVYYCFLEIFLGHYGKSKKMVELLSEYEFNGSSVLMRHRDHYSHSVYVFALGLAVYETNETYRRKFKEFYRIPLYGREHEKKAANLFLKYWGITSLFHDIGYPFELPFEQVMSYFEVTRKQRGKGSLYIAYGNLDVLTKVSDEAKKHFKKLYHQDFNHIIEILVYDIADKLGKKYDFSREQMLEMVNRKPTDPSMFNYTMDHAFFSAARLYREMEDAIECRKIQKIHIDALSAILLHNSLFKYSINFFKDTEKRKSPLAMEDHPLAYLLMLCDELQCWDRTAYGRNTRSELHPMGVDFDFSGNSIHACYYYDQAEQEKIDTYRKAYNAWMTGGERGEAPRLKAYSDMAEKDHKFSADIERLVDTTDIALHIVPDTRINNRNKKHVYLSSSNFLHLYDFAVAIHGRNKDEDTAASELESQFEALSLEYQLSSLNRAKNFSRYLEAVNCFYTDKPVDYEMVTEFTPEQAAVFAPLEHERWIREHQMMGWVYGNDYETAALPEDIDPSSLEAKTFRAGLREQLRCHKLAMDGYFTTEDIIEHFLSLPEEEQDKDWKPFNSMLKLLKQFDGLRIYKLD